jgi:hypothetical protein
MSPLIPSNTWAAVTRTMCAIFGLDLNGKPKTKIVPNDISNGFLAGPLTRKVACIRRVFNSVLGDGARVTVVVVGVVAADRGGVGDVSGG